ncbi:hypothetical protein BDP81DRAFT_104198 [Colletotrichum phormii]|uniref:Uncharacterized protein n=1 Tax=Colletotrichum phormii TaxID=359342 RepID=A0AAI9ZI34_9PEZI|nr:uncharacterized protein BDP81DRAFT_104198 [Colletotrichum phormii]KAK1624994.1 hypothetical protein BDP81DRAFT_104198 [Colletotrichum phormii]
MPEKVWESCKILTNSSTDCLSFHCHCHCQPWPGSWLHRLQPLFELALVYAASQRRHLMNFISLSTRAILTTRELLVNSTRLDPRT